MDTVEQAQSLYVHDMQKDGVVVFNHQISADNIKALQTEIATLASLINAKINRMQRPLKTYADIAERHLGRLDYRCGFHAAIFDRVGAAIVRLIHALSPTISFRHYWGAIPSMGGSGPTNMHRDVYPILNTTQGVNLSHYDISLPPYYFTVLIPLVEITQENGPTAFIKGSHKHPIVDESQATIEAPLLSPGDIVVFDGRTLHKGLSNQTQNERLIAYMTFVANWYHDQTFTMQESLFPELGINIK